jgi:ABC-type transporter Mla subunit MlaD
MRITITLALTLCLLSLPGCFIQRMNDDLAATRAGVERLAELAPELRRTNTTLERTLDQLARSNANVERIGAELAGTHRTLAQVPPRLDESVAHLRDSSERLRHLEPMMLSLRNLDESLAALRKTLENIDKVIPGKDFTRGTPPADRVIERQKEEERKEQQDGKP